MYSSQECILGSSLEEMGCKFFTTLPKVLLNCLQLVPNRAAHIITFTKKYEHITPSLIDLHWLPVEYRIIYKILLLVYKAINGLSPTYISNLLSFCNSSYSSHSCSNKLLQVLRSKLKSYDDQRFSTAGPKLWNSIPTFVRNADSLNFKKKTLKDIFISLSFFLICKIDFFFLILILLLDF